MKRIHILVLIVGEAIIISIVSYIFIYLPESSKISDLDLDRMNAKLSSYSKYDIDAGDLKYLNALGKTLAAGYSLNKTNSDVLAYLFVYNFFILIISAFNAINLSILFLRSGKKTNRNGPTPT